MRGARVGAAAARALRAGRSGGAARALRAGRRRCTRGCARAPPALTVQVVPRSQHAAVRAGQAVGAHEHELAQLGGRGHGSDGRGNSGASSAQRLAAHAGQAVALRLQGLRGLGHPPRRAKHDSKGDGQVHGNDDHQRNANPAQLGALLLGLAQHAQRSRHLVNIDGLTKAQRANVLLHVRGEGARGYGHLLGGLGALGGLHGRGRGGGERGRTREGGQGERVNQSRRPGCRNTGRHTGRHSRAQSFLASCAEYRESSAGGK